MTHPSNGSRPTGSSTGSPRDKVRIRSTHIGTPLTWIVAQRELHLRPQREGSQGVPTPISAHPSHGSRPVGSSTDESSRRGRMASLRIFRHTPDADRTPQGSPSMAPMGNFAWRPHARFGAATRGSRPTGSSACLCALAPQLPLIRPAPRRTVYEYRTAPCATRYTQLHRVGLLARPNDFSFRTYIQTCMHTSMRTYIHTHIHIYTYK